MRAFTKWFFISWILQLIIVPGSMLAGIGGILMIPYWMIGWTLAISLGLPEKGILSVESGLVLQPRSFRSYFHLW